MDGESFRSGYIAAWQSVKGAGQNPDVPEAPTLVGMCMYLAGFSRGLRDANVVALRPSPIRRLPSAPPQ
jgi:hypothetical protein